MTTPLTVASVLRSGGDFTPEHVQQLRHAVATNLHRPHRFVCLSDMKVPGIEVIPLTHSWPKWFSKIELFRPGIFEGPVAYLDLDTWITNSLDDLLAWRGEFAMLSDFYSPKEAASGMMMWTPSPVSEAVYPEFLAADPERVMRRFEGVGDQGFIRSVVPAPDRIQNLFPGKVVSWKADCAKNGIPHSASVVCFHGQPRPWVIQDETEVAHATRYGRWLLSLETEGIGVSVVRETHNIVSVTVVEVVEDRDRAVELARGAFHEVGETANALWVATYPGLNERKAAA